jgi:pyruvate,orthophosphate dikinase
MASLKEKYGVKEDTELTADQLKELCEDLQARLPRERQEALPAGSLEAARLLHQRGVRLLELRARREVPHDQQGQRPAGHRGEHLLDGVRQHGRQTSGTGVAFTRDGATGEDKPMGEYLINAQGEDVVAGIRTPKHLDEMPGEADPIWKKAYKDLCAIMRRLERHYKYPQDVEFTVEQGKLWMLQTRNAKRTGLAGVRWATEMATGKDFYTGKKQDKILTAQQAVNTVTGATSSNCCSRSSIRSRKRWPRS